MKTLRLNTYEDCIVDENDKIIAERPRSLKDWKEGKELCRVFNAVHDAKAHILAMPKGGEINGIMAFCQRYLSNEAKLHLIEYLKSRTHSPKID